MQKEGKLQIDHGRLHSFGEGLFFLNMKTFCFLPLLSADIFQSPVAEIRYSDTIVFCRGAFGTECVPKCLSVYGNEKVLSRIQ